MAYRFFDTEPTTWNDLEAMVLQSFTEIGQDAQRNKEIQTARGKVSIDVISIDRSDAIPLTTLCECKFWNKKVNKNVVHAFRSVCSDIGAHAGLIISRNGFQRGALEACENTNIHLFDFGEFQKSYFRKWLSGMLMYFGKLHSRFLPIIRAQAGYNENGTDKIDAEKLDGINPMKKYEIFFGLDGHYSEFFILGREFPAKIIDPRGDPRTVNDIVVTSYRNYIDIANEASRDINQLFGL